MIPNGKECGQTLNIRQSDRAELAQGPIMYVLSIGLTGNCGLVGRTHESAPFRVAGDRNPSDSRLFPQPFPLDFPQQIPQFRPTFTGGGFGVLDVPHGDDEAFGDVHAEQSARQPLSDATSKG